MTKKQMREVTNTHDKIFIDCADVDAAILAVFALGPGKYGIEGIMPVFIFGCLLEEWLVESKGAKFEEWAETISPLRIAVALESMTPEGGRSSLTDLVEYAHRQARNVRVHNKLGAKDE